MKAKTSEEPPERLSMISVDHAQLLTNMIFYKFLSVMPLSMYLYASVLAFRGNFSPFTGALLR